ncbi:MAG: hypothetical protein KKF98_15150 [Bacteroidetes bacterium]|nr:hypothetical protein [Bacteroidota bacterium]
MKKLSFILAMMIMAAVAVGQSVGINTTGAAPTSGAMLEVIQTGTSETAYFKNSDLDGYGVHIRTANNDNGKYALKVDTQNGDIEGLTVTNYGHVGIGTTSPDTELDVNGVALSNYEGFSYYVTGLLVSAGAWEDLVINTLDYNTFTTEPYNQSQGTFTAPRTGFYRFTLTGYSTTALTTAGDRYAFGIKINGTLKSFAGGNYSTSDTPLTTYTAVVYLTADNVVKPAIFSSIVATLGGGTGHEFWFQGEFVGK